MGSSSSAAQPSRFLRSEDGGKTFHVVQLPHIGQCMSNHAQTCQVTQSIEFSPTFKRDGTIFVSGYGIGVSKSIDRGRKWTHVWDALRPTEQGSFAKVALSPDFADDHTLIASCKHGGRIKLPGGGTKYPSYDFFPGRGRPTPRLAQRRRVVDRHQPGGVEGPMAGRPPPRS